MDEDRRKGMESLEEAARRLLAGMDARKKKGPEQPQNGSAISNVIELFPRDWREEGPGSSSSPPRTSRPNCRASWGS
jgi:hypothetical protein